MLPPPFSFVSRIRGLAPGVTLASARVYGVNGGTVCNGFTYEYVQSWVVDALAFAQGEITNERVVTNFSANPTDWSELLDEPSPDKYVETWKAGFVHFVSAGNAGDSTVQIPARLPGAELDPVNAITNLTCATAICISGDADSAYLTGTSFASPGDLAVAALVLSENASLSSQAVEWVMRETAVDLGPIGRDVFFGHGLPKADAAVARATDVLFFDGFETGSIECWNEMSPCSGGN